jgi:monofunctional biosynthetic peptidoglycan transglycosylase
MEAPVGLENPEAPLDRGVYVKHLVKKVWRLGWRVFFIMFIAQLCYIILLRWIDPPITFTQIDSWANGNGFKRTHVAWDHISSEAKLAVIASEDQLFFSHDGFDWKSIGQALKKNKKSRRVRGASTLSQQVAKNVFLWQGRNWFRKGLEAYFTFMIEHVWGKRRILEVYLNEAEMGKGLFGIEVAARTYFKKSAAKLTSSESAMIAAVLPSPKKYSIKPLSNYVASRHSQIMVQMNNLRFDETIVSELNN